MVASEQQRQAHTSHVRSDHHSAQVLDPSPCNQPGVMASTSQHISSTIAVDLESIQNDPLFAFTSAEDDRAEMTTQLRPNLLPIAPNVNSGLQQLQLLNHKLQVVTLSTSSRCGLHIIQI